MIHLKWNKLKLHALIERVKITIIDDIKTLHAIALRRNTLNIAPMLVSVLLSIASLAFFALIFLGIYFGYKKVKQKSDEVKAQEEELDKMNKNTTPDKKVETEFEKEQKNAGENKLDITNSPSSTPIETKLSQSKEFTEEEQAPQTIETKAEPSIQEENNIDDEQNVPPAMPSNDVKNNFSEQNDKSLQQTPLPQKTMLNLDNMNNVFKQNTNNNQPVMPQMTPNPNMMMPMMSQNPIQQPFTPTMSQQIQQPQIATPQMPFMPPMQQNPNMITPTINANNNISMPEKTANIQQSFVEKLNQKNTQDKLTNLTSYNNARTQQTDLMK